MQDQGTSSRCIFWILVASGLLKLGLALLAADLEPRYDEVEFVLFGRGIYEDGARPVSWRAPGYQAFVAAGLALSGGKTIGIRLLQVALSLCATWLVYRIGARAWDRPTGLLAAALVAFHPSQVAFSHLLWSETLYGFLILLALERILASIDRNAAAPAAVAGLALGAATLTRSIGLALAVATAAWWIVAYRARSGIRPGALFFACVLLVVLPWSWSASRDAGRLVAVDTNAGFNFWSGSNEAIPSGLQALWTVGIQPHNGLEPRLIRFLPDDDWRGRTAAQLRDQGVDEIFGPQAELWYREQARAEITSHPGAFLARIPLKLAAFWAPDFFLPRHLVRDWYGELPQDLVVLLVLITWSAAALALIGGPAALGVLPSTALRSLSISWIFVYLLVHGLAYGHSRLHQPLVPLLLLAVAAVLTHGRARLGGARWLRRGLPWAALAVLAWCIVWPALGGLYLLPSPRHVAVARGLAAARALPLPASERLTWMLASVEASNGRLERADRILAEDSHADHPWSLYLRATIAETAPARRSLLESALDADPQLFAGWVSMAETLTATGDHEAAARALDRAAQLRPWHPRFRR
jgi:4-amino-4-deoxy-L-arabinose transferase-like glycosyltransferase